jgi:hypothetical protein
MSGSKDRVVERVKMREVASVFRSRERLESAVGQLLLSGFDRADIDISAGKDAIRERLGGISIPAEELPDVPGVPRQPFFAREDVAAPALILSSIAVFAVATIAAYVVVAAGGGAGSAAIAALLCAVVTGALALLVIRRKLETRLTSDSLILWVRVRSPHDEEKAAQILHREGGEAIRVHEIEIAKRAEDLPLAWLRVDPWLGDEPLGRT